jgi:hypothetical protein
MSIRRLLPLLGALAAILGLSALPSASLARTTSASSTLRQAVDPSAVDDSSDSADDPTVDDTTSSDSCDTSGDQSAADPSVDDPSSAGDSSSADGSSSSTDSTSADDSATADDSTSADDSSTDDPSSDGSSSDGSSSDGSSSDGSCSGDVQIDPTIHALDAHAGTKVARTGVLTQTIDMPGPGTIDETLTLPGAVAASVAGSAAKLLGSKHLRVARAQTITIRVKLNQRGRKALRTATRALSLRLNTSIHLTAGTTSSRSATLKLQPKAAHPKRRAAKHAKH